MVSRPELLYINIPGENGYGLNFLTAFKMLAERQFKLIGHPLASPGYSEAMYEALMGTVDKMGRHIETHHPEKSPADTNKAINAQRAPYNNLQNLPTERKS